VSGCSLEHIFYHEEHEGHDLGWFAVNPGVFSQSKAFDFLITKIDLRIRAPEWEGLAG
jgi:hypothetical protein